MIGSRSGIRLNVANVAKDAAGFDDLDDFWGASGRFHHALQLDLELRKRLSLFSSGQGSLTTSSLIF